MNKPQPPPLPKRGGITRTLLLVLFCPIYLLVWLLPRDDSLCAFGSGHGWHFIDNSKYLFLYAARKVTNVRCVFLSRRQEIVELLTSAGFEAVLSTSLRGMIISIRARRWFVSHSTNDINPLLSGGAQITQLWHGTPLKKIAFDLAPKSTSLKGNIKNALKSIVFKVFKYLNTTLQFNHIVISSEKVKQCYLSAFRISDDRILVLGQARNDCLTEGLPDEPLLFPETSWLESLQKNSDRIITWMPTHRLASGGATEDLITHFDFDIAALEALLEKHSTKLVIKVHFLDAVGLADHFDGCRDISLYPYADPYPLLRFTDVLITDYSSVYFDFLLTGRPVLFSPFDRKKYIDCDAGFYFDYDQVTPGTKCANWPELLAAMDETMLMLKTDALDPHAEVRRLVCRDFNDFPSGSCQRVAERLFPQT